MKNTKTPCLGWEEEQLMSQDLQSYPIAGVDEAGRGPLAGRVYAAAVILPYDRREEPIIQELRDSKKLTAKKRLHIFEGIKEIAVSYCISYAEVWEIESYNILESTLLAMRRAVEGLEIKPYGLLIDGNINRGFSENSKAVKGGDNKSPSIAAASILAKVSRDIYCAEVLDKTYPEYGFVKHKGYGTAAHYTAIEKHGLCPLHRKSFFKNYKGGVLLEKHT